MTPAHLGPDPDDEPAPLVVKLMALGVIAMGVVLVLIARCQS